MQAHEQVNQIQSTKISLMDLYRLSDFVYYTSKNLNSVNKSYETEVFMNTYENVTYDKWKYRINKYGFRGKDWSFEQDTFGFFGCSFTFGIGVDEDLSSVCGQKLKINTANLGIPGASPKNIVKTFSAFANLHPMKYALISIPEYSRIYYPSYIHGNWKHCNLLPTMKDDAEKEKIKLNTYKYYLNDDVLFSELADSVDWADSIAREKNIKLFWCFWSPYTYERGKHLVDENRTVLFPRIIDHARDGGHPGQKTVYNWADNVVEKIKNV